MQPCRDVVAFYIVELSKSEIKAIEVVRCPYNTAKLSKIMLCVVLYGF